MKSLLSYMAPCAVLVCMASVASAQTLTFTPTALRPIIDSSAYSTTLVPSGGSGGGYTFSVASGSLPDGITLSSTGVLSGTTTVTPASFTVGISVTDSASTTVTQSYSIAVVAPLTADVQLHTANPTETLGSLRSAEVKPLAAPIVPDTAYGVHTSIYDGHLVSHAAVWGPLLQAIGVNGLRYPGGNDADVYHFSNNSTTPGQTSDTNACSEFGEVYFNPTNNFGAWLQQAYSAPGIGYGIITTNYGSNITDANATITKDVHGHPRCSNPSVATASQEGNEFGAAAEVAYANSNVTDAIHTIGQDSVYDWGTNLDWAKLRTGSTGCTSTLKGVDTADLCINHAGYGVRYWEVGNEIYGNGYYPNGNWQTDLNHSYAPGVQGPDRADRNGAWTLSPETYGAHANDFINLMRSVDNSIKIGTVVNAPSTNTGGDFDDRSLKVLCTTDANTLDFVAFHYYPGNPSVWAAHTLSRPQLDIPGTNGVIARINNVLSAEGCKTPAGYAPAIFVTETNATTHSPKGGTDPTTTNGWANIVAIGQFATDDYLTMLEAHVQNIDWTELHNSTFIMIMPDGSERPLGAYYGVEMAHLMAPTGAELVPCTTNDTNVVAVVCHASLLPDGNVGVLISNIGSQDNDVNPPTGAPIDVAVNIRGVTIANGATTAYTYQNNGIWNSTITSTSTKVAGNHFTVTVPPLAMVEYIITP